MKTPTEELTLKGFTDLRFSLSPNHLMNENYGRQCSLTGHSVSIVLIRKRRNDVLTIAYKVHVFILIPYLLFFYETQNKWNTKINYTYVPKITNLLISVQYLLLLCSTCNAETFHTCSRMLVKRKVTE